MTFTLVKNHKLYITTESTTAGLATATEGLYSTSPGNISAGTGIGSLGDIPENIDGNEINLLEAISFDFTPGRIDERVDQINGNFMYDSVKIRRSGEITITRKKRNDVFGAMFNEARAGVNTTDGDCEDRDNDYVANNSEFGYRIVIYNGSEYTVLYHCEMTNYHAPPGNEADTTIVEVMTFRVNHYEFGVTGADVDAAEVVH